LIHKLSFFCFVLAEGAWRILANRKLAVGMIPLCLNEE
jgi:hypothetical protein